MHTKIQWILQKNIQFIIQYPVHVLDFRTYPITFEVKTDTYVK